MWAKVGIRTHSLHTVEDPCKSAVVHGAMCRRCAQRFFTIAQHPPPSRAEVALQNPHQMRLPTLQLLPLAAWQRLPKKKQTEALAEAPKAPVRLRVR